MAEARPERAPLLWVDPPIQVDDYAPAIWTPLRQLLSAHRRLQTMVARLPEAAWLEPSAAPGWRRREVLAHLSAQGHQHHRPLRAVLAGSALREWLPDADDASGDSDEWNARALTERAGWTVGELESNLAESLRLWSLVEAEQLLQPYGLAPNLLSGIARHGWHVDHHADQVVNGPQMLR